MSDPNPKIYAFEDALETAVQGWLLANGINDPKKQRGNEVLKTPRVEAKYISAGFAGREHYFSNAAGRRFLDITGDGTLFLKIVTRRDDKDSNHAALRGGCRWLMQHASALSSRMPFHIVEKIIETQSSITVQDDNNHDISSLSFTATLRIRPAAFPED